MYLKKILILSSLIIPLSHAFSAQEAMVDTVPDRNLPEYVVTGSNALASKDYLPYSVSIMKADQIESTNKTQLLSAMSGRIPSLFVAERNVFGFGVSSGGSGGIKIRGIGGSPTSGVLMMVDGRPQFAGIFSHHVADTYEAEYVDHVEVLRGPASVLYGSNAMGGVINVITKKKREDGVKTVITSQYGSYCTWQNAITNMIRHKKFFSTVSVNYDRTDGTQKDFDFKQGGAMVKLGYDFSNRWHATLDYSVMKFVGNDPIYPKLKDSTSTDIYHQNIVRGEVALTASNHYQKTNGTIRAYYSYGNHHINDPLYFHSLDDRFGIIVYQNFQLWDYTGATVGFDFDTYRGEIPVSGGKTHKEAPMMTIEEKKTIEYSPYITLSQGIWKNIIVLNGGLRVACSDNFGTHLIPQGGITIRPGKQWTIRGSVAKGFRNPSFKEMYLYKPANPDLEPESMINYEASIMKGFSSHANLEFTAYLSKGSNLIQTVQMKNVNTGEFENKGFEFAAHGHPVKPLMLHASYSFLHTDVENLTAAPKHQYHFGIDWQALKQLSFNAEVKGAAGLYVSKELSSENYALLNLKVNYTPIEYFSVFLQGNNLTHTHYTINEGYKMPGINVTGGIKVTF